MTLFVRKLNIKKWIPADPLDWLEPHDIEADPLGDLATSQNTLSIFEVEDEAAAKQAVAAVAAGLSKPKDLGYVIIASETLQDLGLEIETTAGLTVDQVVNAWHRNIVKLSATRVTSLAKALKDHHEFKQLFPDELGRILKNSVIAGHISRSRINISDQKITRIIDEPLE